MAKTPEHTNGKASPRGALMKFHLEAVKYLNGSISIAVIGENEDGRLMVCQMYASSLQGRMAARAMRDWLNAREVCHA